MRPPDRNYDLTCFSIGEGVDVHGEFVTYPGDAAAPDDGLVRLWFFVQYWNARMKFTARECSQEWA